MKQCPTCCESVQDKASKCPHCHSDLGPFRLYIKMLPFALLLGGGVWFYSRISSISGIGPSTMSSTKTIEQIAILSHRKIETEEGPRVVGEIKNNGSAAVSSFSIEVSFFNKENQLVDVGSDAIYSDLGEGQTRNFKISFSCGTKKKSTDQYDHYDIKVQSGY